MILDYAKISKNISTAKTRNLFDKMYLALMHVQLPKDMYTQQAELICKLEDELVERIKRKVPENLLNWSVEDTARDVVCSYILAVRDRHSKTARELEKYILESIEVSWIKTFYNDFGCTREE